VQRPIRPRWLLRLAAELAGEGRGQPRNTNLRRAASTAYYALFHELTLAVVRHSLPGGSPQDVYAAARYVSHASIKQVCAWIAGDTPPLHLVGIVDRLRNNPDLTAVATAFVDLHEQRERADYDHLADFTRPGTHALIAESQKAVAILDSGVTHDDFKAFLGLILLRAKV
jgi:hypothetical protein